MTPLGPLFWYELLRLPRRRQMHLWRMLYAGSLLLGLVAVYLRTYRGMRPLDALIRPGPLDLAGNAAFAESFLMVFLALQQIAVIVLTPLYTAGSIAEEKERRTFDFLLSSPLPHSQILLGKLLSRLIFVGSILAVGLPVLMLVFLFGGIDFEHLLAGFAVSAVTAIFLGCVGVLFGCVKKNLREALPGIVLVLLMPAIIGLCGQCFPPLCSLSPITVLVSVFDMWLTGDPAQDTTWSQVGMFAALHLTPSIMLFLFAKMAMGEKFHPGSVVVVTVPIPLLDAELVVRELRRTYDVPPLGFDEDPLVWKESRFHVPWLSPERGCLSHIFLSIITGFGMLGLCVVFGTMAGDLAEGRPIYRTTNMMVSVVFLPVVTLWPAFLGARVATSLGRERSGQTLLTLLTLPSERIDLLKAIARAILFRDRWWIRICGGILALGVASGGVPILSAGAVMVLSTGCAAWAIAFAIWLSVQLEAPARASMIFLSVWGGLLLAPWFAAAFAGPEYRDLVQMVCPPKGMVGLLDFENREMATHPVRIALITGSGLMLLATGLAWDAVRTFDREGRD